MNAASPAAASHAPAGAQHDAVPAHARQLAAQLSGLFQKDVQIVKRLNDAHDRLQNANEQLSPGLTPGPIAALLPDGEPATTRDALQQIHWQIHHAFCDYQHAAEQRRQLAVDVGELSQQLTESLSAAGWNADRVRHANVHTLAGTTT